MYDYSMDTYFFTNTYLLNIKVRHTDEPAHRVVIMAYGLKTTKVLLTRWRSEEIDKE